MESMLRNPAVRYRYTVVASKFVRDRVQEI